MAAAAAAWRGENCACKNVDQEEERQNVSNGVNGTPLFQKISPQHNGIKIIIHHSGEKEKKKAKSDNGGMAAWNGMRSGVKWCELKSRILPREKEEEEEEENENGRKWGEGNEARKQDERKRGVSLGCSSSNMPTNLCVCEGRLCGCIPLSLKWRESNGLRKEKKKRRRERKEEEENISKKCVKNSYILYLLGVN